MTDREMNYAEMAREARSALERERERLEERALQVDGHLRLLGMVDELIAENRRLTEEREELATQLDDEKRQRDEANRQLDDEKRQRAELEMRLSELTKLSAGVARKSSQEELEKALRTFVNKSKQKRLEKRTAVKEMVLELAVANGLTFPEDLARTIESLDDEQPQQQEPRVVNVAGSYNDIHDNRRVEMNERKGA